MRIRRFIALAGIAFGSALISASGAPTCRQQSRKPRPPSGPGAALIDCLDAQVQERFGKAIMDFGYGRVADTRHGRHRFLPENPQELAAVTGFEGAGLQVVLYVAGRQVLEPGFDAALAARRAMQGPVSVTQSIQGAPARSDLLDSAILAFRAFARGEDYEFESGPWQMIARPVRAKDASCLQCHYQRRTTEILTFGSSDDASRVRIGDPLGAIIYGYRQR
jgi:hypothetical protein